MSKQTYQDRNKILREMGYKTYKDYLESELWESIRERVFKNRGDKCVLCSNPPTCVHHRGYGKAVLLGEELHQLVAICFECHKEVEFKANGDKRTLVQSQSRFDTLLKKYRKTLDKNKFNKMIGQLGYCKKCGKKAKKKSEYCKEHTLASERKMCPQCKKRPAGNHGKWCYPCLFGNVNKWKAGARRRN